MDERHNKGVTPIQRGFHSSPLIRHTAPDSSKAAATAVGRLLRAPASKRDYLEMFWCGGRWPWLRGRPKLKPRRLSERNRGSVVNFLHHLKSRAAYQGGEKEWLRPLMIAAKLFR
jgi:hypothetical protein